MPPPPTIATVPLTCTAPIKCRACPNGNQTTIMLGVALAVTVVRVTCAEHGVVAQLPLAPGALSYYVPEMLSEAGV